MSSLSTVIKMIMISAGSSYAADDIFSQKAWAGSPDARLLPFPMPF